MHAFSRRNFIQTSAATGVIGSLWPIESLRAASANEEIRLGFISCGSRANELMSAFEKVPGTNVVAICDPDESILAKASKRYPKATAYTDLRKLLDDKSIDAVVVATCNHWHCLAAIWAMQAGKDVYVEKPLSHTQWEGEQAIAAARKYDRICQVGTQQRSDPMQAEIKKFLHDEKALGAIQSARVNRYGVRGTIGKRATPLPIDPKVNYDLWLGPAQEKPIFRDKLHYDWHWDFNTGSGEMGNWGVHVLDDLRNNIFRDSIALPKRIFGGGGRVAWNDAGESPNVHFVYFDTGSIPVVIGLANITNGAKEKGAAAHPGPGSGYIAYCEGGHFEGQRGKGTAYDTSGKLVKSFKGTSGMGLHQQNFVDAVRSRDRSKLNAEIQVGHDSTGWCNLANVAYQTGRPYSSSDAKQIDQKGWHELLAETSALMSRHNLKLESDQIRLSPILEIDAKSQRFVGTNAEAANRFLKRDYREGFVVPQIA
ncbi:MAG: Gfo/Idh/MocA family oxidoreductase [Pirellulaceae bacterium]|nr:Gfo/Idh/MocA family oxidoreductase [Pirellulaceae bacterium]